MSLQISSEVVSIDSSGPGKIVTVNVTGPKFIPNHSRELRARARALIAVGFAPSSVETVTDVAMGDVQRMTRVVTSGRVIEQGNFFIREQYQIRVNQE